MCTFLQFFTNILSFKKIFYVLFYMEKGNTPYNPPCNVHSKTIHLAEGESSPSPQNTTSV